MRTVTLPGTVAAWIEAHANHAGDECLIWPFSRNNQGYADGWISKKRWLIHRYYCQLKNGPPPTPKHHAAHSCGKGKAGCVNPNHVSWKTAKENTADKVQHGTQRRGVEIKSAVLNDSLVWLIRNTPNWEGRQLSEYLGVAEGAISNIRNRKAWKHVP